MQGLTCTSPTGFPKRVSRSLPGRFFILGSLATGLLTLWGCASQVPPSADSPPVPRIAADIIIESPRGTPRPPFRFNRDDDRLLEEVQRASFWYLWNACDPQTGMVYDRSSAKIVSVAGVGFQLAAIPAAVQRGWISQDAGRERSQRILRALESCPTNRKAGLFYHFLEGPTAAPVNSDAVSTIDSALLFAGMIVAGEHFGGETRERAERLFAAADWSFFVLHHPRPNEPYLKGFISLGWKPDNFADPTGAGKLLPYAWADAADEQRLVCFLAAAAPNPAHRVDPSIYYRLRRMLGEHENSGIHVWFPWSGALFTHFFAHCFIDYAHMGPDHPADHGALHRSRVDWWENARRGVELHRIKARQNPLGLPTFGEHAWGLTASDCASGYCVPGIFPRRISLPDQIPQFDFADFTPKDDFGDGTIAPYGAGCAIMFNPAASVAALRHYRSLKTPDGRLLVWKDPGNSGETGEYGFRDAFNLGTGGGGWVAPDCVAIDQGPMVLAVENARSGLIWTLFHRSQVVQDAMQRLGLKTAGSGHRPH